MAYKGAEQGMTSVTETPIQGSEQFMQSSEREVFASLCPQSFSLCSDPALVPLQCPISLFPSHPFSFVPT